MGGWGNAKITIENSIFDILLKIMEISVIRLPDDIFRKIHIIDIIYILQGGAGKYSYFRGGIVSIGDMLQEWG